MKKIFSSKKYISENIFLLPQVSKITLVSSKYGPDSAGIRQFYNQRSATLLSHNKNLEIERVKHETKDVPHKVLVVLEMSKLFI
jgi:hypothetical protein